MRLPRITAKELLHTLRKLGFRAGDQSGSHLHIEHPVTGRFTIIPMHAGKIIGPGLLKAILRQLGVDPQSLDI